MNSWTKLLRVKAPLVGLIASFPLLIYGRALPPSILNNITDTKKTDSILSQNVIVSLNVVRQYFPEITHKASASTNTTAVGNPKNTISVIYANHDSSQKVTITVDQYANSSDASSAYQQAIEKSKLPGFSPLSIPNIGLQSFAGTVTRDKETHIGLGVLDDNLIIGVTLAGYDASPNNIANLVQVASTENAVAKAALSDQR